MKIDIRTGDLRTLKTLDLNARFMRHEQYQQLVRNLRRDQVLTSTPFVWHDVASGDRIVLSGNHRTKASVEAGIEEITWLETSDPLTESQRIAIQLSHNAIAGEDDPAILKTLSEQIDDLDLRQYAGLDDATLELLADLDSPSLGEANLAFQTLAIVFLPDDLKEAQGVLNDALGLAASSDAIWVAAPPASTTRPWQPSTSPPRAPTSPTSPPPSASSWRASKNHADELVDVWYDRDTGEPKHHGMAPLFTLFHTDAMPTKAAAVVEKALQQAVAHGDVPAEHRYKALELWATQYLDTPAQATMTATKPAITLSSTLDPWEQQPDETPRKHGQFVTYRDLGRTRTLQKAADGLQLHAVTVRKAAATCRWRERAESWDRHLDQLYEAGWVEERRKAAESDARILGAAVGKPAQRLGTLDAASMSVGDFIRVLDVAMRHRRVLFGDPGATIAVTGPGGNPLAVQLAEFAQMPAEQRMARIEELTSAVQRRTKALDGDDEDDDDLPDPGGEGGVAE
ncbi:hypothetical protein [Streptomyces sp. NPDC088785]|uniref:hypothetical protein n=1 Tax=Streptomyces sp. NPDC088785 TaxID=3365897 RepID=UPI0037F70BE3